jgi:uncharacterized delta-60 repeat protein
MKKEPFAELIAEIARRTAPVTAVATSLVVPFAQAASGDLDPAYSDHGRLGPIAEIVGPALSIEPLEDGGALLAGGQVDLVCRSWYCFYDYELEGSNFVDAITPEGAISAAFEAAHVTGVEVLGIARQADGKVVAAGRRVGMFNGHYQKLVVFRLEVDGSLDADFGNEGIVELDEATFGTHNKADAVLLEPDGRIVIAGARDDALMVLRLNADGSLDDSFGDGGTHMNPGHSYDAISRLERTASGGYRVTTADGNACRVLGLTASGAIDAAYGEAGYAAVAAELGGALVCHSMAIQPDDRLLVTGAAPAQAFAVRLLANGTPDPSFVAADVVASVSEARAIAVAPDGKILVGGEGLRGATVMRLQVTGELDALFGDAGVTTIDLRSETGASPRIHGLEVQPDGGTLVAGGDYATDPPRPYTVRLLGDSGGDSPGVVGIAPGSFAAEESGEVEVTVRRTGGRSGAVSVEYRTEAAGGLAGAGQDYQETTGVLHWSDGDTSEKTVVIPILPDDAVEEQEDFALTLDEPQGGAGLGRRSALIGIQPDGAPAGQFSLDTWYSHVEEPGVVEFLLSRNYYFDGEVCVTLEGVSGSALSDDDFVLDAATHCWADQDQEAKYIQVQIADDGAREADEDFSIRLSNPTGGAIVGPRGAATFTIMENDLPSQSSRNGGGGSTDLVSLLLLGLAQLLRAARSRVRG